MIWRAIAAFIILMLAGLNGMLAGAVETCTGNTADSLFGFVLSLPLNFIGMALLGWRANRLVAVMVGLIPALFALDYTGTAIALASGTPACTVITGDATWPQSGEEAIFATGWGLTAAIFWIGLAVAVTGGYRPANDRDTYESDQD